MYQKYFRHIRTYEELLKDGESTGTIRTKVRKNELRRIARGVYACSNFLAELSYREKLLAQIVATVKSCKKPVVLSHISAALWLGTPLITKPTQVHLSVASDMSHRREGVKVYRNRPDSQHQAIMHNSLLVTNPRQTLKDCLSSLPLLEILNITNYFLQQELLTFDTVYEILASARPKDRRKAQLVSERLNIQCESPLETLVFNCLCEWQLRRPAQQLWIRCGIGQRYRADFAWEDEKVILEADGIVKYSGEFGDPVKIIQSERARQRELERLGWRIIRVEWDEIVHSPETLRQRLFESGIR